MNRQLDLLDILTIISFTMQMENQERIIDLGDVQREITKAVEDIHGHLSVQDSKLNLIMEMIGGPKNGEETQE